MSEMPRQIQRRALDLIEAVRAQSLGIGGQYVVARDILRVAKIQIQIPFRQDIPPTPAQACIDRGRRRRQIVPGNPAEQAECERAVESMTIIEGAQADEQMIIDLIQLDARSQIVGVADGPARAYGEVRSEVERRRRSLLDRDAVDTHLVQVD